MNLHPYTLILTSLVCLGFVWHAYYKGNFEKTALACLLAFVNLGVVLAN